MRFIRLIRQWNWHFAQVDFLNNVREDDHNLDYFALTRALISTNQSGGKKAKKQKTSGDKLPNLFVQSETGSGKTLAYLLPIVQVCYFVNRLPYR